MSRRAVLERITKETRIEVELDLDGTGQYDVHTPLPFLSHMIEQLARHSMIDLKVRAEGDVEIDGHHTTEDLAITIGKCLLEALGDKRGIRRYGSATVPMDEACVTCAIDLSGRTFFVSRLELPKAKVGAFDSELAEVFFEGLARGAQCNLHMYKLGGENLHHQIEISFKALARALRDACEVDPRAGSVLPSTKGTLTE
ncbi:MAG: imidazoleglycerol-phosphate dehydratase HisB [Myxococcota bacterium]|nr:imidazoleglycerol-phosphate dehydratase HisB [Myxococcota bacterium]